jgi:hypothetical protein
MGSKFEVEMTVREEPQEAQSRAAGALEDAAGAVGLRLAGRAPGQLRYRPPIQWPLLVALYHRLNGEQMAVSFRPADGGGTAITLQGSVARGRHALAADPEHWAGPLAATPVPLQPTGVR